MHKSPTKFGTLLAIVTLLPCAVSASNRSAEKDWRQMTVTASAYTLAKDETKSTHKGLAAWGDKLEPGMRAIAVSRDLIGEEFGHLTRVKIEGLPGTYRVRDKMNKRWRNKIDIFVPTKKAAFDWGRREVTIRWLPAD